VLLLLPKHPAFRSCEYQNKAVVPLSTYQTANRCCTSFIFKLVTTILAAKHEIQQLFYSRTCMCICKYMCCLFSLLLLRVAGFKAIRVGNQRGHQLQLEKVAGKQGQETKPSLSTFILVICHKYHDSLSCRLKKLLD
jgi:hypothetical protein